MDIFLPSELGRDRQLEKHTHPVQSRLSTSYSIAGVDYPGLDLRSSPIDIDHLGQDFSSFFSTSIDGGFVDIGLFYCSALCSSRPRHDITFDSSSMKARILSAKSLRSSFQFYTGQILEFLDWIGNQGASYKEPHQLQDTTVRMENMDADARAQMLDTLCKRGSSKTKAIED